MGHSTQQNLYKDPPQPIFIVITHECGPSYESLGPSGLLGCMLTGTNSLGIKGHLYSLWMLLKVVVEKVMDKEDKWLDT